MQRGFTLIELSVVLVIIGLIVGGILVGQDLIKAAEVRAQISQIEKYNAAVNTFYGKYGALPGDMPAAIANRSGGMFIARGSHPGQGDGNGLLEGNQYDSATSINYGNGPGENGVFWRDLSSAGMIDVTLNSAAATGGEYNSGNGVGWSGFGPLVPQLLPAAKIGGAHSMVYVWSGGIDASSGGSDGHNYFTVSDVEQIHGTGIANGWTSITVRQARSIDTKVDDSLPQSGRIQAFYTTCNKWSCSPPVIWARGKDGSDAPQGTTDTSATAGDTYTCYDNSATPNGIPGVAGAGQHYSTEMNGDGLNCALSFRFQ